MQVMENKINSYPKIYNLGHPELQELFSDQVIVEEKVDGSQFSFGVINGELMCRSKSKQLVLDAPEKMFQVAIDSVKSRLDVLKPNWIYRGEYLQKPQHNTICYDSVPVGNIIIFDIDNGQQKYWSPKEKQQEAEAIGLTCVPMLFQGSVNSHEMFKSFLETDSVLGGTKIEGVVIKNYAQFGRDKKVLMGKFVSETFKEKHQKKWRKQNPLAADVKLELISSLKTEARYEKAVQHLKESGNLTGTVKDIGNLIKEIQEDVKAEETEYIKQILFDWAWPAIQRGIVGGVPYWYKDKLAQSQFDQEETYDLK